jgi:hypothetical protein
MENSNEVKNIEIDQEDIKHLNKTRKWSMFIAIIGLIFLGLVVAIGGIAGTFLSVFNSGDQGLSVPLVLTIVLIVLLFCTCFFPGMFLLRFSKHIGKAVNNHDKKELSTALRNLKYFFVYLGVVIIIILSLYLISIIFSEISMEIFKGL